MPDIDRTADIKFTAGREPVTAEIPDLRSRRSTHPTGHPPGAPSHHGPCRHELRRTSSRHGPADLATVDTLITAGIATSRAEVLRWAVGRIRENPAYAQIQERVHEIGELKAQF
jgi:hypothetical protein